MPSPGFPPPWLQLTVNVSATQIYADESFDVTLNVTRIAEPPSGRNANVYISLYPKNLLVDEASIVYNAAAVGTRFDPSAYMFYFTNPPASGAPYTIRYTSRPQNVGFAGILEQVIGLYDRTSYQGSYTIQMRVLQPPGSSTIPTAPSNLVATANGARTINLVWDDNADNERSQEIWRKTTGGTFTKVGSVAPNVESYSDTWLQGSTTYTYKILAVNTRGTSESNEASATTDAPPVAPVAPSELTATAIDSGTIDLEWTDNATNEDGFLVYRAGVAGGPYTKIATVRPGATAYRDGGLPANTEFFYVVSAYNAGGESSYSNEASAVTDRTIATDAALSGFVIDNRARITKLQVAGQLQVWNDYGRPLIYDSRRWYKGGVKPQLSAGTLAQGGAGALTGTFTAYLVLKRGDAPRSTYCASNSITVTNKVLTFTPPNDGAKVTIRDLGYDVDGTQIDGADRWELYLYESNIDVPVRVADLPITTITYTTPSTLRVEDLDPQIRRPLEVLRQSNLPPACAFAAYYNNRVHAFGEISLKPTSAEVAGGASIAMTNGSTTATFTNWTLNDADALIGKELFLSKKGTGWFCVDVNGSTVYLLHPSEDQQRSGFQGATGTYYDFAFAGRPSRMYRSAFFSGESGGNVTFSPQTFPPLNYIESELDPDDNQDPVGAIQARSLLFIAKRGKWFVFEGGAGTDNDPNGGGLPTVVPVSRNSGLLAPGTLCVDQQDNVYYLSPTGPAIVTRAGVTQVGRISGNAFLLSRYFDLAGAEGAVGAFYPKYDWFVVAGLSRIGDRPRTSGFIYEVGTGTVRIFTFPRRITALLTAPTNDGDSQLLYGDEANQVGVLFQRGVYTDDIDFTRGDLYADEKSIGCSITTGVYRSSGRMVLDRLELPIRQKPLTTATSWTWEVDAEPATSDASSFSATTEGTYTTADSRAFYPIEKYGTQAWRARLSFSTNRDERVTVIGARVRVAEKGGAQDQAD